MNLSVSDIANYVTIASLPLALVTWLFTREHFARFWKRRWKLVVSLASALACIGLWRIGCLDWLAVNIQIPLWILLCLGLVLFGALVSAALLLLAVNKTPKESDYRADNIFGVDWQWQYLYGEINVEGFSAFCPQRRCRSRLEIRRRSSYAAVGHIALTCPNCGFSKDFDHDWGELQRKAAVEVERRLRTGEFKSKLQKRA
jgi:hypothetical protein